MKKHLAIFSAILMVMLCVTCINPVSAATPAYDVELITNGNCDNGTVGWSKGVGTMSSDQTVRRGHSGSSIKFEIGEEDLSAADANKALRAPSFSYAWDQAGHTRITGYIHVAALSSGAKVKISPQHNYSNGDFPTGTPIEIKTVSAEGEWIPVEFSLNFSANSSYFKTVYTNILILGGTGTVYVDDFSAKNVKNLFMHTITDGGDPLKASGATRGQKGVTIFYAASDAAIEGRTGMEIKYDISVSTYHANTIACTEALPVDNTSARNAITGNTNYRLSFWFKAANEKAVPYIIFGKGPYNETNGLHPGKDRYVTLDDSDFIVKQVRDDGWKQFEACFTLPEIDTTKDLRMLICSWSTAKSKNASGCGYYDGFCLEKDYAEDLTVTKENNAPVKEANVGEKLNFSTHILSDKTAEEDGKKAAIMLAVYDKSGVLKCVDVKTVEKTVYKNMAVSRTVEDYDMYLTAGDTFTKYTTDAGDVTLTYTVPEVAAGCTIKAYCLNGISSLKLEGNICEVQVAAE